MHNAVEFLIVLSGKQRGLQTMLLRARHDLDEVERRAKQVSRSVAQAFSFSSLRNSLSSIPGFALLTNPYALTAGAVTGIAKVGMEAESTAVSFRTLVGDIDLANKKLEELYDYATRSTFSRLQVTDNAKLLMNYGIAAEQVVPLLKQLGDISGGNAERLRSLALAFGQVSSKGRLMGQEVIQLTEAGFNPLQELVKMTGKSYQELQEMSEKGMITAQNVAQAIAHATSEGGRFHGMMDNLAQTASGQWNQMVGEMTNQTIKLYDELRPTIMELFGLIREYLPVIFGYFRQFFELLVGVIKILVAWRREIFFGIAAIKILTLALKANRIIALATTISYRVLNGVMIAVKATTMLYSAACGILTGAMTPLTAAQWLLNAAMASNPIGIVIVLIGALVAAVIYCWVKFAEFRAFLISMWDVMKSFGTIIRDYVVNAVNELLDAIGNVGRAIKLLFSGDFKGAAEAVGRAADGFTLTDTRRKDAEAWAGFKGWTETYNANLAIEKAKDAASKNPMDELFKGMNLPQMLGVNNGGSQGDSIVFGDPKKAGKGKSKGRGKTGDAIATGGTRNTQITMNIGKLVERINVSMMDKTDTSELERVVLSSVNRALAIATSTDR
jgi:putative tape measure domain protein